ncbi:MAG: MBL fold metallo-hydrolase [Melioribacteraceae bacterium]
MKTFLFVITIVLSLNIGTNIYSQTEKIVESGRQAINKSCEVSYVANEGFLLETKNHKVLIDALFGGIKGNWCDQPNDSLINKMIFGVPPFDNIDLVLITHKHTDHFNKQMTIDFLRNNSKSVLVCPDQVNELLKKDADYSKVSTRITSLKPSNSFDTTLISNKINLRILRFNHGSYYLKDSVTGEPVNIHKDIENFGYLIETDGFSFFHSGDDNPINVPQYKSYNFQNTKIDVALLDRVFLTPKGMDLVKDFINTRYLIYMHIEPTGRKFYQSIKNPPGATPQIIIYSKPLERKRIF